MYQDDEQSHYCEPDADARHYLYARYTMPRAGYCVLCRQQQRAGYNYLRLELPGRRLIIRADDKSPVHQQ